VIRHIVFLKFKTSATKQDIILLEDGFKSLPGLIPEIKLYEFGRDIMRSERSFDFALISGFDDMESLRRYSAHPDHQKLLKHITGICDSIKSVDFEIDR
jgi:Stress responsive A/B Barrel Domain